MICNNLVKLGKLANMDNLMGFTFWKAAERDYFFAHALSKYIASQDWKQANILASKLGISEQDLFKLGLCRTPKIQKNYILSLRRLTYLPKQPGNLLVFWF